MADTLNSTSPTEENVRAGGVNTLGVVLLTSAVTLLACGFVGNSLAATALLVMFRVMQIRWIESAMTIRAPSSQ